MLCMPSLFERCRQMRRPAFGLDRQRKKCKATTVMMASQPSTLVRVRKKKRKEKEIHGMWSHVIHLVTDSSGSAALVAYGTSVRASTVARRVSRREKVRRRGIERDVILQKFVGKKKVVASSAVQKHVVPARPTPIPVCCPLFCPLSPLLYLTPHFSFLLSLFFFFFPTTSLFRP